MSTGTKGKEPRDATKGIPVPQSVEDLFRAIKAVEYLMAHDCYYPGNKEHFAFEMEWFNTKGYPDVAAVQRMCNVTRDQDENPVVAERLGGFRIHYSPSRGGMVLWDPESADVPMEHYAHGLAGDITRQQQHKTENRRRQAFWVSAAKCAFNAGDVELGQLITKGQDQLDRNGIVDDHTINGLWQTLISRRLTN